MELMQWLTIAVFAITIIAVAYVVGFFVMLAVMGWEPHDKHKSGAIPAPVAASATATISIH